MSLPVRNAPGERGAPVVNVRLMGAVDAVATISTRLREVVPVAEESRDYPRRRDLGVRRYLTVVLESGAATPVRR